MLTHNCKATNRPAILMQIASKFSIEMRSVTQKKASFTILKLELENTWKSETCETPLLVPHEACISARPSKRTSRNYCAVFLWRKKCFLWFKRIPFAIAFICVWAQCNCTQRGQNLRNKLGQRKENKIQAIVKRFSAVVVGERERSSRNSRILGVIKQRLMDFMQRALRYINEPTCWNQTLQSRVFIVSVPCDVHLDPMKISSGANKSMMLEMNFCKQQHVQHWIFLPVLILQFV